MRHGLLAAIDTLKSRITSDRPETATFARSLERFDLDAGIEVVGQFFICCFSGDGDDLGQWRAYADHRRGFALAFHTASLEMAFTQAKGKPIKEHATFPITSDDAELRRIQTVLVDFVDPLISLPKTTRVRGEALHAYMMNLLIAHALNGIRRFMFFKHEAYKNETNIGSSSYFDTASPRPP